MAYENNIINTENGEVIVNFASANTQRENIEIHTADLHTDELKTHTKSEIHIVPLQAEQIGMFNNIPITNTLITSWVVIFVLVLIGIFIKFSSKLVPNKIQSLFEIVLEFVNDYMADTLEDKKLARFFLPLILTIFLFIVTSNLLEFTPGIGSVGIKEGHHIIPFFRSVNTDLNVTLALALIAFVVIELTGMVKLGFFKYMKRFINFSSPLNFIVGIIELGSELVRIVSFSFRLFGNILAGEVLISVITYFVPYVLPSALMGFETFIGFVQAGIFALLTLLFIKLAVIESH